MPQNIVDSTTVLDELVHPINPYSFAHYSCSGNADGVGRDADDAKDVDVEYDGEGEGSKGDGGMSSCAHML